MLNRCDECAFGQLIEGEGYKYIKCATETPGQGITWFDGCPYFSPKETINRLKLDESFIKDLIIKKENGE